MIWTLIRELHMLKKKEGKKDAKKAFGWQECKTLLFLGGRWVGGGINQPVVFYVWYILA